MTFVFFDISLGGKSIGRLTFKLFDDIVPKTALNFKCLATGERGERLCYKKSTFHRVIRGFMCQGGDFTKHNGTGGESIFGEKFSDESFAVKHTKRGLLSMANAGPNTNGSQFFITFSSCPHLNSKHVVFGEIVGGHNVLDLMEQVDTDGRDKPVLGQQLVIEDSGVVGAVLPQSAIDLVPIVHTLHEDADKKRKHSLDDERRETKKKSSKKKRSKKSSKRRSHHDSSSDSSLEDDSSNSSSSSDDVSVSSKSSSDSSNHRRRKHKSKKSKHSKRSKLAADDIAPESTSLSTKSREKADHSSQPTIQNLSGSPSQNIADSTNPTISSSKPTEVPSNTYVGADGILYKGRGQRRFRPAVTAGEFRRQRGDQRFGGDASRDRFNRHRFHDENRDRRSRDRRDDRYRDDSRSRRYRHSRERGSQQDRRRDESRPRHRSHSREREPHGVRDQDSRRSRSRERESHGVRDQDSPRKAAEGRSRSSSVSRDRRRGGRKSSYSRSPSVDSPDRSPK